MAKRMHASLKEQVILQSAAIYGNLQQPMVIYSNLSAPIILPSIVTAGAVTVRKEGRISVYIDIQTA
jgi:hypothetical protein